MTSFESNEDGRALWPLIHVLEHMREYDQEMNLSQFLVYLLVAADPGVTTKTIEERLNLPQSVSSRHLAELSDEVGRRDYRGRPLKHHDLLSRRPAAYDTRTLEAIPTARGRRLAQWICESLFKTPVNVR